MDLDYKEFENKTLLYAYLHEQLRLIGAETSDLATNSEIVMPIFVHNEVVGVKS